eukprot:m.224671 g.224671  ORF g.224671 m.224671 type:complete len:501 (-) comp11131_c0_seq1:89-1591(-)
MLAGPLMMHLSYTLRRRFRGHWLPASSAVICSYVLVSLTSFPLPMEGSAHPRICPEVVERIMRPRPSSPCSHLLDDPKLCVAMVGLPARGKSYIAKKLAYYLNWVDMSARIFNLGEYRRRLVGAESPAEFFHPDNDAARETRRRLAMTAMDDMFAWMDSGGMVGIIDATNSTIQRRTEVVARCKERGIDTFFVESVCNDDEQVFKNIMQVKVRLVDYKAMKIEDAIADFKERIDYYKTRYIPLNPDMDASLSFITMVDVGRHFTIHSLQGYIQMRIVRYLVNLHLKPRVIYLSRHGESEYNVQQLIGGDSDLTPRGEQYALALREFMSKENVPNLEVWCSTMRRAIQTVRHFSRVQSWKALDELNAGECDGMTYEETKLRFPDMYDQRERDKYHTRYPRGESYADLVERLEPRLLELERVQNVLVVCHQAVARCLLAYFQNVDDIEAELPYMEVPLHTIIKITPLPTGCDIEMFPLGVNGVNTHRPRLSSSTSLSVHPKE